MRFRYISLAISILFANAAINCFGQTTNDGCNDIIISHNHFDAVRVEYIPGAESKEKIYSSAEKKPQFPGGESELLNWVNHHIIYPKTCMELGIQGKVITRFVVKKDGSIGKIEVVRSKDSDLDAEAVRVVKTLPKFTPGLINGKPVDVWYVLPVTFRIPVPE